jgi:hypothetical protein
MPLRDFLAAVPIPDPYVLGPCPCQGCGGSVVWIHEPSGAQGWLHEDGRLACPRSYHVIQGEGRVQRRREYQREYKRRTRAAAKERTE